MASHIPLLEDDRVIGLDGKPLAPLPINDWSGLPFETHPHMRKGEVATTRIRCCSCTSARTDGRASARAKRSTT
jgi:hypothetical protein